MKVRELQGKSVDELKVILVDLLKQQFGLRMQHATGQLGNSCAVRQVRRDIARVKTILAIKGN
ncbi:MAG: 50S ribosomal protein L29 [Neisseria sp.]|nr:MAG: 50S ribosomal protein L29 [Neisseria sp.]